MKDPHRFTVKYSNGAKFSVTYYPEPDPSFPYEDRIELKFHTEAKKLVGVRMTFAEALMVVEYLTKALNKFMDDKTKPGFDIPMEAT